MKTLPPREHYLALADKLRKPKGEADGLCASCNFWHPASTQTVADTVEMQCNRTLDMTYGVYGQDGKAIITPADFGCVSYRNLAVY